MKKTSVEKKGDYYMKKQMLRKIIAVMIAFFMVIGFMSEISMPYVEAAEVKIISVKDLQPDEKGRIFLEGEYILNVDQDITLKSLHVTNGSLTIRGGKTLIVNSLTVMNEVGTKITQKACLVIEKGTNIIVNNDNGSGEIFAVTIITEGNITLNSAQLEAADLTVLDGNINGNNGHINCMKEDSKFKICGGNIILNGDKNAASAGVFSKDTEISGGSLEITYERNGAIFSDNLKITGGKVKCHGDSKVIDTDYFNMTGGYLEVTSNLKTNNVIGADEEFVIGDNLFIKTPEGGYIYSISIPKGRFWIIKTDEEDSFSKIIIEPKSGDNSNPSGDGGSSGQSYSNEWVNGKWYDADGKQTYAGTLQWKSDATGWWVEDTSGWYPVNQWQKIDGKWYYFLASGYMDYSEYREGCWLNSDGSMADGYTGGHWCSDSSGWWYEDNGWYPCNQYLWIDGVQYWFGASGYWE